MFRLTPKKNLCIRCTHISTRKRRGRIFEVEMGDAAPQGGSPLSEQKVGAVLSVVVASARDAEEA